MKLRVVTNSGFTTGDLVTVKSLRNNQQFCIIGFKINEKNEQLAILKALFNDTHIIEKPLRELNNLLIKGLL